MRRTPHAPHELHSPANDISAEITQANAHLFALRQQRSVTRETSVLNSGGWLKPFNALPTAPPTPTSTEISCPPAAPVAQHLTAYPDMLHAMLRVEETAIGRLWLLCRALDHKGRGWLSIEEVRQQLTDKQSDLRICGWRRLRQLLSRGEGRYWQRDSKGRIWLSSRARLADDLGVSRMQFRAVKLPLDMLSGSIGDVKAHFMVSLHSSRSVDGDFSQPISRATLRTLSGVSERTQARYDARAGIEKRQAMAIGGRFSAETARRYQWAGKSTFQFTDRLGKHGAPAETYIAWHLPNQYAALHEVASKSAKRRVNRQVARHQSRHTDSFNNGNSITSSQSNDLAAKGARGNGRSTMTHSRVFYNDGVGAGKNRENSYWATGERRVWYFRPNQNKQGDQLCV